MEAFGNGGTSVARDIPLTSAARLERVSPDAAENAAQATGRRRRLSPLACARRCPRGRRQQPQPPLPLHSYSSPCPAFSVLALKVIDSSMVSVSPDVDREGDRGLDHLAHQVKEWCCLSRPSSSAARTRGRSLCSRPRRAHYGHGSTRSWSAPRRQARRGTITNCGSSPDRRLLVHVAWIQPRAQRTEVAPRRSTTDRLSRRAEDVGVPLTG